MKKVSIAGRLSALIICLSLILGIVSPLSALAAPSAKIDADKNRDGTVEYVVIGSYDAAGVGISGYDASSFGTAKLADGSYADVLKKKLEAAGKAVNVTQISIEGMRAEELRYILDTKYEGDSYTAAEFLGENGAFADLGGVSAVREKYINAIKSAELITLDVGFDNFATYAFSYIFESKYDADFTIFDDGMQKSVNEIKSRFEEVLGGYVKDTNSPEIGEFLNRAINGFAYALVGYCHNFDKALGEIYALNPDVTVAVTDIRNPVVGLTARMEGLNFPMSLDLIYGIIIDLANVYMATLTDYKDIFNFAYLGSGGMNQSEIENYNGNPATISADLAARLDAFSGIDMSALSSEARLSVRDTMMTLLHLAFENGKLDLTSAAAGTGSFNKIYSLIEASKNPAFNLEASADYKALINDAGAMSYLAAAVRYSLGGTALLDRAGHKDMADKLYTAITEGKTGTNVISEDMNEIYSFLGFYFNRDTLLDIEYTFKPYYTCDKNSFYVALGDGSASGNNSYPSKLADKFQAEFGFKKNVSFVNYSNNYALSGKFDETPDVTLEAIKKSGEENTQLFKDIKKADLITLSYTTLETTRYMLGGDASEINWFELGDRLGFGDELLEVSTVVKEYIREAFGAELPENMLKLVIELIEKYAYAYLKRAISYAELLEYIHEINPEALVLIVGTYNEMEGFEIRYNGMSIPLGSLVQYLVDAANLETLVYSVLSENTSYIAAPKVETVYEKNGGVTVWEANTAIQLGGVAGTLANTFGSNDFLPSDKGHEAIVDAVLDEKTTVIVGEHECAYDNACDTRCNICMAKRTTYHKYSAVCDASCNVCGSLRHARAHDYAADCDSTCNICGDVREAAEHTYSSDCDSVCNLCGNKRDASGEHTFADGVDAKGKKASKCTKCGYIQPGDGLSVGAIIGITAGAVVVLGGGGFALFWFVIKKKSLTELLALFAKK